MKPACAYVRNDGENWIASPIKSARNDGGGVLSKKTSFNVKYNPSQ
ncbi:MAG: hypothetical protein LBF71_06035 [Campylobacteraceae bacterium]|nr:hypothetical protein [Campylobacteraceae bacterium]